MTHLMSEHLSRRDLRMIHRGRVAGLREAAATAVDAAKLMDKVQHLPDERRIEIKLALVRLARVRAWQAESAADDVPPL